MELFAIHCTTCRARLKVNDESVIGDILACPKCGSMVQVVPPLGWQRLAGQASASAELATVSETRARIDWYNPPAPVERAPADTRSKTAIVPPALPPRPAAQSPPPHSLLAQTASPLPSLSSRPPLLIAQSPAAGAGKVSALSGAWLKLAARARQDWLLLSGGLAGGIVLGGAVWLALAMQAPLPPEATDNDSPSAVVVAQSGPEMTPATVAAPADQGPLPASTSTQTNLPATSSVAIDSAAHPLPAEPAAQPVAVVDAPEESRPAAASAATAPKEPDADAPGPTIRLEPAPAAGDASAAPSEPLATTDDHPAGDPADAGHEKATPAAEIESAGLARRVLSTEEVNERLSQALPSVEFAKVPLVKFVDFISDFTGVRVVIDEAALAKIGASRQSPVTIKLSDTTAGATLRAAAAKLGLSCVVRDGRVVLSVAKGPPAAK